MDIAQVLVERGKTHGDYADHASLTQTIKQIFRQHRNVDGSSGWHRMNVEQQESLDMIAHKLGRILSGNPHFHDHWVDISGYAKLVADRLEAR